VLAPGILALVGHQDLAQSLGVRGQYSHPLVREANDRVRELCKRRWDCDCGPINQPDNAKGRWSMAARDSCRTGPTWYSSGGKRNAAAALAPYRKNARA